MKILLDECLPLDFRNYLSGDEREVHTVEFAGFKGLKNGHLLSEAESAGYDAMVTVDRSIQKQQNILSRRIAIVVVRPSSNQLEDLIPLVDAIAKALEGLRHGEVVFVPSP
ncbi:hypothetical protein F183_A27110 [Bryobacterales bacterium F-183]|nr:hypothetical protein F183_A27110 [Bryobacterales bacterium F-183]